MSDNFVAVERSYLSDLIHAKGRMETIIDCLLEEYIPKYNINEANRLSNEYWESQVGLKYSETVCNEDWSIRPLDERG